MNAIGLIAIWFRVNDGNRVSGVPGGALPPAISLRDLATFAGSGVLRGLIGLHLLLHAPGLIGPVLLSVAVHMTGLT